MVRLAHERILLIGDAAREVEPVLAQALPRAQITRVANYFDGIAELSEGRGGEYGAVLASAEPIERRPEAAIATLRELTRGGRLVLFGKPAFEALSRKMLQFGCDDYVITPPTLGEMQQIFGAPLMRIAPPGVDGSDGDAPAPAADPAPPDADPAAATEALLHSLPLADIVLDALAQFPGAAHLACAQAVHARLAPHLLLTFQKPGESPVPARDGWATLYAAVRNGAEPAGSLYLFHPANQSDVAARHFLTQLAHLLGKLVVLQNRHNGLTKQAFTDHLTGVWNRRYFEHFLAAKLQQARNNRSSVTLLLFDIDDFKQYNDQHGHGLGDEILRETAALMRRCVREHDLVARLGGDEFAVVFWEKEGPRQPKDPAAPPAGRAPAEPLAILKRFQRLIATQGFRGLGATGRGNLTISGGMASYPWDGRAVDELIAAADQALIMGAKKNGKNRVYLVGGESSPGELPPTV